MNPFEPIRVMTEPLLLPCIFVIALSAIGCARQAPSQSSASDAQKSSENERSRDAETKQQVDEDQNDVGEDMASKDPMEKEFAKLRDQMVTEHLAARDIVERRVLEAMRKVPRHEFVPVGIRRMAYRDSPLPIGQGQTISQPYIVALMTQLVEAKPDKKALDIGTGSGYQAAVLAELVDHVYSIEIVESLANDARKRLQRLEYANITVRHGDGYQGWQSEAPFDIIIVAAAPDHIPQPLIDQLAPGGKLIIPVGDRFQRLTLIAKDQQGTVSKHELAPVAFVPMTGQADR